MTVAEGVTEKKSVLVGVRIDSTSRQLLDWAIVKVAEPGDRVIAVHVSRDSDPISEKSPSMDDYLEVYEGLCNVMQVDLRGQILRGSSVRKVLVREAKHCSAMAVVVGISYQNALGGWFSMAKYCVKRLPPTTTVLAIHNGKIVFERGSTNQLPGLKGDPRPSISPVGIPSFREKQPGFANSVAPEIEKPSSQVGQNFEHGPKDSSRDSEDENFRLVDRYKEEVSSKSISLLIRELPEPKPGWPLLRRVASVAPEALRDTEVRKLSVVQWAMNLPNRSPLVTPRTQIGSGADKVENQSGREISTREDKSIEDILSVWEELPKELELLLKTNMSSFRWFSLQELKNSTSQFSSENLIGKGGCSHVYEGRLPDGMPVAVKILKSSREAWKDFALEVNIMSTVKHKHITPLIGLCVEDNNLISVYDFLSKGSLEENLHGKNDKSVLSWEVRFNVAVGVAEALNYLHKDCSRPVIHRDVKSSNILLCDDLEPQLSDFGLAIWAPTTSSYVTHSDVVGTFGYLAPEYFMYGKVSEKIDVYSYGVVLLELITGRKPISTETSKGQQSLVMWAKPTLEGGDLKGILDPNLAGKFEEAQMQSMVLAATLCITKPARLRPKMSEILELLRGKDIEDWMNSHIDVPNETDNQLDDEIYPDSSAQSHLGLALLDVDDGTSSFSSMEQNNHQSMEDYLKGRWSRSSSFD